MDSVSSPPVIQSKPLQEMPVAQQPIEPVPNKPHKNSFVYVIIVLLLVAVSLVGIVQFQKTKTQVQNTPALETSPKALTLSLTSPSSGDLAVNNEILVKGTTLPNATVVVYTQSDETSVDSDANGNFEETILLTEGENTLTVTAFSDDGQEKSVTVNIVREGKS